MTRNINLNIDIRVLCFRKTWAVVILNTYTILNTSLSDNDDVLT